MGQPDAAPQLECCPCAVGSLAGFEDFYRGSYREVVKAAMIAGATRVEAEDAASRTFLRMLERWPVSGAPLGYARKAVVHNFIQDKTRGTARVAHRLVERGHVSVWSHEGEEDAGFTAREDQEQIAAILSGLPMAQREVMRRITDGLTYEEIADDLGVSREVVRRRLCDARARLVTILDPDGGPRQPRPSTARSPQGRRPDD